MPSSSCLSITLMFSYQKFVCTFSHSYYVPCQSHSPWQIPSVCSFNAIYKVSLPYKILYSNLSILILLYSTLLSISLLSIILLYSNPHDLKQQVRRLLNTELWQRFTEKISSLFLSDFKFSYHNKLGAGIVQSVWKLATDWTTKCSEFESRKGQEFYVRRPNGFWSPTNFLSNVYREFFLRG
jgi:hypothetical protein